jgi:hypothetical protein
MLVLYMRVRTTPSPSRSDFSVSHVSESTLNPSPAQVSPPMANYDCDPFPHVPAGMAIVPAGPLRAQRGHVIICGDVPAYCDDWAVATLAPVMS